MLRFGCVNVYSGMEGLVSNIQHSKKEARINTTRTESAYERASLTRIVLMFIIITYATCRFSTVKQAKNAPFTLVHPLDSFEIIFCKEKFVTFHISGQLSEAFTGCVCEHTPQFKIEMVH